ncbi:MAG: hypothetical protein MJ228_04065 [Bacilli bacterium]|nr:hypothetical protein [Bacilli bacterium]
MKNRSKMILGLASMLGISAGAAAVSGFAWFTTQRTATVGAQNFKVGAAEGSLEIGKHTFVTGDAADTNINGDAYSVADNVCAVSPTAGKELADVSSGDGINFYKATVVDSTGTGSYVVDKLVQETGAMSGINSTQMVKVQWSLDVTNTSGNPIDVYLSSAAIFAAHDGAANDYSAYYRLAIFADTNTEGSLASTCVFLYTNNSHKKFISTTDYTNHTSDKEADGHAVCPIDGTGTLTAENSMSTTKVIRQTADIQGGVALATASPNNQLLIKGLTDTKVLRFVVWCEGTATPEAAVQANAVDMSFQLVGLTA